MWILCLKFFGDSLYCDTLQKCPELSALPVSTLLCNITWHFSKGKMYSSSLPLESKLPLRPPLTIRTCRSNSILFPSWDFMSFTSALSWKSTSHHANKPKLAWWMITEMLPGNSCCPIHHRLLQSLLAGCWYPAILVGRANLPAEDTLNCQVTESLAK